MKLTARDKKLLIILGIVIFLAAFFKFLLLPKLDTIAKLNLDINTLSNTYAMNMVYKAKTETIDSDIKILSKKLKDLRVIYPPSIGRDELLIIMKDIVKESELEVTTMKFEKTKLAVLKENKAIVATTETTANTTNGQEELQVAANVGNQLLQQAQGVDSVSSNILNYLYMWGLISQQADDATESVVIPDGKGYSVSVLLEAEGNNEQLKAFFSSLSKLKNKTYCKSASITELSTVENFKGTNTVQKLKLTAEIAFYGIMDKGAGEYYMLPDGKWMPIVGAEKTNIFEEYSGYEPSYSGLNSVSAFMGSNVLTKNNDESASEGSEIGSYDFSIVASAFGGGLAPSVSIACKNPAEKVTYLNSVVYGDKNGVENSEIFIEQKEGKYYCKFKTDHESYPDKQYAQTLEFIPEGKDLRLVILSSERNIEEDKAGVSINIINNTDKTLTYKVLYEDKELPRIKIGKTVGSVIYEK